MKTVSAIVALCLLPWRTCLTADAPAPVLYLDVSQPVDQRVADLISRLTLEEKATLLNHRGPTVERFNIRSDQWNQCLNGVQWDRPTTLFPIVPRDVGDVGHESGAAVAAVLSDEARAIYNGWHLDPKRARRAQGTHLPRPGHQHRAQSVLGPQSRVLGRRPVSHRPHGGGLRAGIAGRRSALFENRRDAETFCGQQCGNGPPETQRRGSRTDAARILAAALARGGGGRQGVFAHGQLQRHQRRSQQHEPLAAHGSSQGRLAPRRVCRLRSRRRENHDGGQRK